MSYAVTNISSKRNISGGEAAGRACGRPLAAFGGSGR